MAEWIRFDDRKPSQGEYIVAITHRDGNLPTEVWEKELERNAVGVWIDGEIWEGNRSCRGFTHWLGLPDRPSADPPAVQPFLWDFLRDDLS